MGRGFPRPDTYVLHRSHSGVYDHRASISSELFFPGAPSLHCSASQTARWLKQITPSVYAVVIFVTKHVHFTCCSRAGGGGGGHVFQADFMPLKKLQINLKIRRGITTGYRTK